MTAATFSGITPDQRPAQAQVLIRDCRRYVPKLSKRLPLPIGTTQRLWQNLLLLAQIFSDNYNADRDNTFGAGEECEQYVECFRAWIGLLAACDLPLPEQQTTDEVREICAELMLQRLIFMIEHIREAGLTPETETPLGALDTFKHGLLRNLWPGVRRQEKLSGLDPERRLGVIADIKALEYELATLQYDTPEFADWENRYQNVLDQADRLQPGHAENGSGAETEKPARGADDTYVHKSPWQIRTRLLPTVRFENVQERTPETAGLAVLAYRAGLVKPESGRGDVQKVLELKMLGISRFSPER